MVLIRKSYFRSHLETLKRKENTRRKIANGINTFLHFPGRNRPTQPGTNDFSEGREKSGKIDAEEGIGAAMVGGGSVGIGLGVGLGRIISNEKGKETVVLTVEQPSRGPTMLEDTRAPSPGSAHSSSEERRVLEDQLHTSESPKSEIFALPPSPIPQYANHVHFSPPLGVRRRGGCSFDLAILFLVDNSL